MKRLLKIIASLPALRSLRSITIAGEPIPLGTGPVQPGLASHDTVILPGVFHPAAAVTDRFDGDPVHDVLALGTEGCVATSLVHVA